jgi:hypothetical protein
MQPSAMGSFMTSLHSTAAKVFFLWGLINWFFFWFAKQREIDKPT